MNAARIRIIACALALVAGIVVAVPAPASAASEDFNILAGNGKTGEIDLLAIGPYRSRVDVFEQVGSTRVPLRSALLSTGAMAKGKLFGYATFTGIAKWRCDRRERTFTATATLGGVFQTEPSSVKTPSCSKRFKLSAPTRAKPGRKVKIAVEDTFKLGDMKPRLCVTPPKAAKTKRKPRPKKPKTTCRTLNIRPAKLRGEKTIRVKAKGTWKIQVRTAYQRTTSTVAVGVKRKRPKTGVPVLLVGDSLMSQLVTPIADRLERKADVTTLLRGGGRLTEPGFDWFKAGAAEVARIKPRAAVVLIGGGDGFPIKSGNTTITCCGPAWTAAYRPFVIKMMQSLSRNGATAVAWVLNPAAEAAEQRDVQKAINDAAIQAAPFVNNVVIVDLNMAVSPGFQYAEYKTIGGRTYKIRAADGIHFTVFGAAVAGNFVADSISPLLNR